MPGRELRPYQVEAVEAIATGLSDGGSGQLHAACSSGKSFMAMRAAERLVGPAGLVVVLAPSLALVSQILDGWKADSEFAFARFAVCSDETVGKRKRGEDEPGKNAMQAQLEAMRRQGVEVSTDCDVISKWLVKEGPRLIVGTYLSALRLAEAVHATGVEIDMLVCDEAHHLAGNANSHTRRIMDPAALPTRRRLYMTGTPRISSDRDEERRNTRTLSMDDEAVFGPVFYTYPFSRGIAEGYLADYRIAVIGVTDREVQQLLEREDVEYADGLTLHTAAAQVALARAYEDFGLRRAITFHGTISDALTFARTLPATLASLPDAIDVPVPTCLHVNGAMDGEQRGAALDQLRNPPVDGWSVVSNVRCLSEGVDVPSLDGVLFGNPKRSTVDIVQAASRALRPHPDTPGLSTIIVPVVIPAEGDEAESIDPGAYEALFQILRALKEHDDVLSAELNSARAAIRVPVCGGPDDGDDDVPAVCGGDPEPAGVSGPGDAPDPRLSKIRFHGIPPTALGDLRLVVLRSTTSAWWERYAEARAYYDEHGHLDVPLRHGALGTWIGNARHSKKPLAPDRREALDRLGMIWNKLDEMWERNYAAARQYHEANGHLRVARNARVNGVRLGECLSSWRQSERLGLLDPERRRLLDEIGMIWNIYNESWERGIQAAVAYKNEHGDLRAPRREIVDGFPLGQWLSSQRGDRKDGKLDPERIQILDHLGMIWNVFDDAWERGIEAAGAYKEQFGNLATPLAHVAPDGFKLGAWIGRQRQKRAAGRLTPERERLLDELGMVWDPNSEAWMRGLRAARAYREMHGHLNATGDEIVDGFPLGRWLSERRQDRASGMLRPERLQSLDDLGISWNVIEDYWEQGLDHARTFREERGHLLVPTCFQVGDYRLGAWIGQQRARYQAGTLSPERTRLLEDLGMRWNVLEEEWRQGFEIARAFRTERGHLRVHYKEVVEGFKLGQWINVQRKRRREGKLALERLQLLDGLGMVWDPQPRRRRADANAALPV